MFALPEIKDTMPAPTPRAVSPELLPLFPPGFPGAAASALCEPEGDDG